MHFDKLKIKVSKETQDLLRRMLTPDPNLRINWYEIYNHPALNKEFVAIDEPVINEEKNIEWMKNLKKSIGAN